MANKSTTWILGSGFSRSLGGPLLRDLLSEKSHDEADATFALVSRRQVYEVFAEGRSRSDHSGYWEDAEQFLDYIDTARKEGSPRHDLLKALILKTHNRDGALNLLREDEVSIGDFWTLAVLSVAAECSTYTATADLGSESWTPYKVWADKIPGYDNIVTFNYDTVVEKLADYCLDKARKSERPFAWNEVVKLPNTEADGLSGATFPRVYKLHGSVNWNRAGKVHDLFHMGARKPETLFNYLEDLPLIAAPGPDKKVQCTGPFKGIWEDAALCLETADAIVFLGYRFPPSDSEARSTLLGAMAKNTSKVLHIHTVLGPDLHHPDTARLDALIRGVMDGAGRFPLGVEPERTAVTQLSGDDRYYKVVRHPLWVQDFLSLPAIWNLHGRPAFKPRSRP